jgi:hypothetical protein
LLPLGLFYNVFYELFYRLLNMRRSCGYLGKELAGAHSDIGRGADQAEVNGGAAGG